MSNNDELEELEKEVREKQLVKVELDEKGKKEAEKNKLNAREKYQELSTFQLEMEEKQKEMVGIEADLKEKDQLVEKFDQEVRELNTQVKMLENEVDQMEKLEEDLNHLIEEQQDENFDAQKKADDYQVDIDTLTEEHAQKVEEEKTLGAQIQEEEKVSEKESKDIEQLEKSLREAKADKSKKVEGIFGAIASGIAGLCTGNIPAIIAGVGGLLDGISSGSNLDEMIAQIEAKLQTSRRNLEQSKQKKKDLADKRETAKFEISRISGERSSLLQLKAACFETSDQINGRITACQTNAQQKRNQQESKSSELREKQTSLNQAVKNFNETTSLRDNKLAPLARLGEQIQIGQNTLINLGGQAQDFMYKSVKIAVDAKTAVNQVSNQINSLQNQVNQLNILKVATANKNKI